MTNRGNASVWVIIGLLVVAAILLFAFSGDSADDSDDNATTTDDQPAASATADPASAEEIQAAISSGGSVQCAYDLDGQGATSYIKDGKIRTVAEVENRTSNMIYTDGQIHVWEQGAEEGITFNPETFAENNTQSKLIARPDDVSDLSDMEGVSCSVADVDDEMFDLPEGVVFQSFSAGGQIPQQ